MRLSLCETNYRLNTHPRPEIVVGWYHSHPGFGCWLSSVDVHTQQVRVESLGVDNTF